MYDFDKQNIFFYIVFGFVLIICLKIYNESDAFNLKCIISDVDGEKYCVRERSKLQLAADLLAKVTGNCKDLVTFVGQKYPDNEVYFNCNVFVLGEGKIWYGDLDVTKEIGVLSRIASISRTSNSSRIDFTNFD